NGNAELYRITGLAGKVYKGGILPPNAFDPAAIGITTTKIWSTPGVVGTGVAIDDNDSNHVLICAGTYNAGGQHVWVSNNAMSSTPTFNNITNNLPSMPVFDVLIDSHNPKM